MDLLKNGSGAYVGFLMPAIRDSRELTTVYNPSLRKRKAPGFNWYYLHATALNTAWIIQAIHEKGYVLGDIKAQNILVGLRQKSSPNQAQTGFISSKHVTVEGQPIEKSILS